MVEPEAGWHPRVMAPLLPERPGGVDWSNCLKDRPVVGQSLAQVMDSVHISIMVAKWAKAFSPGTMTACGSRSSVP